MTDDSTTSETMPEQSADNAEVMRDECGRWKPGHAPKGGRPKGARDGVWLMKAALTALGNDEEAATWLLEQKKARPAAFLAFINRLMPTKGEVSNGSEASFADLLAELRHLADERKAREAAAQAALDRIPMRRTG